MLEKEVQGLDLAADLETVTQPESNRAEIRAKLTWLRPERAAPV